MTQAVPAASTAPPSLVSSRDSLALEDTYRWVFEHSVLAKSITLPWGEIHVNEAFASLLGYSKEELLGRRWEDVTHPEDLEESRRIVQEILSGDRESARFEKRYLRKDGEVVFTEVTTSLRRDEEGRPLYLVTSVVDRTERRRAEDALRESERAYRSLFQSMLNGYARCRMIFRGEVPDDFVYLEVNPAFERLTGLKDVLGKRVSELIPGFRDSNRDVLDVYGRVARNGGHERLSTYVPGLGIWFEVSVLQPSPGEFAAIFDNITERKTAEKALRDSERRFREVVECLPHLVWTCTAEGPCDYLSPRWIAYTGIPEDVQLGFGWLQQLHPDDRQRTIDTWSRSVSAGRDFDVEFRIRRADGAYRWFKTRALPLRDESGRIVKWFGSNTDIEDVKRANWLRSMVEANIIGIVVAGAGGEIREANDYYLNLIGFSRAELEEGKVDWRALTPPEWLEADERAIAQLRERGACDPYEKEYRLRDGRRVSVLLADAILPGPEELIIVFALDITGKKRAENELRRSLQDLQRSNRELEQFAYIASHDLQEPLRMVSSFTQLLARRYGEKLDQDARDFIGFAVDGANRMQRLINDLLAYSRIGTRGKALEAVDSHTALGQALANLSTAIGEAGALVTNEDLPVVLADLGQLVQVFQNLLSNALKFARPGVPARIHVSARRDGELWTFSVRDNGVGVAPEFFDRIFVIFQRLHGRDVPGTGIGLAICKRIVERHGGRIWLDSEVGIGSAFHFSLPARS